MTALASHWVGSLSGESPVLAVRDRFVLAGVEWAGPERARLEVRARDAGGRWSRWAPAGVLGHDSDGESVRHAYVGQPVWFGASDAVQLRSSGRVQGVSLHLVPASAGGGGAAAGAGGGGAAASMAAARPLAEPQLPAGPGQPAIFARRAWAGAGHLPSYPPAYGDVRMAFVHHTDNPNGYAPGQVPAMLRAIYAFHRYVNGWNDIGYNFIVDLYGGIWEARAGGIDQAVCGAHAGGYNLESTGVALLGTFSAAPPTQAALAALERLLAWKLSLHGIPVLGRVRVEVDPSDAFYTPFRPGAKVALPRIAGHRDGCTTTCPGSAMYARLGSVRAAASRLVTASAQLTLTASGGVDAPRSYLAPDSALITVGQPVTLSGLGAVRAGGAGTAGPSPMAGAPIELQAVAPARTGSVESVVAQTTSGADGSYSVTLTPASNLLVRALHPVQPAAASPLVLVAVAPAVTLSVTAPAPGSPAGTPISLSGTVQPVKAHVTVEAHHATGRRRLAKSERVRVDPSTGAYAAQLSLKPGAYQLVALTAPDSENVSGTSAPVSVTV